MIYHHSRHRPLSPYGQGSSIFANSIYPPRRTSKRLFPRSPTLFRLNGGADATEWDRGRFDSTAGSVPIDPHPYPCPLQTSSGYTPSSCTRRPGIWHAPPLRVLVPIGPYRDTPQQRPCFHPWCPRKKLLQRRPVGAPPLSQPTCLPFLVSACPFQPPRCLLSTVVAEGVTAPYL